jgi:hypothetical protein
MKRKRGAGKGAKDERKSENRRKGLDEKGISLDL